MDYTDMFRRMAAERHPALLMQHDPDTGRLVDWDVDTPFAVIMENTTPPISRWSVDAWLCADLDEALATIDDPMRGWPTQHVPRFIEAWDLRSGLVFAPYTANAA